MTRSDIMTINPHVRPYERQGGLLKRNFAEFKSLYGTCMYEASGQGDSESFLCFTYGKTFLLYAFFFLKIHPVLAPLATRAVQGDAQREEGVGVALNQRRDKRPRDERGNGTPSR